MISEVTRILDPLDTVGMSEKRIALRRVRTHLRVLMESNLLGLLAVGGG